jgi:mannitol-1-phosphate/altronate dehydrogenase
MLHLHFGAGRLGLGLIAPYFQKPGSELYLLNRSTSTANETGSTQLEPQRRNELLRHHPKRVYVIQPPGGSAGVSETVPYDGFCLYEENNLTELVLSMAEKSQRKQAGVIVTASILKPAHYRSVVQALNALCQVKEEQGGVGSIFLVACENTVSAQEVFRDEELSKFILPATRCHVHCVHALVDRMCVGLEEYPGDETTGYQPTVLVRAEEYGSLKLELCPETEPLRELCRGSRVEFSQHLDVEKQIKSWLLNGAHWLIALSAFQESQGNTALKLNEFLANDPRRQRFAAAVLQEMRDGVEILLRKRPEYQAFVQEVPPGDYLDGAAKMILHRFLTTEDSMSRILARFRAPKPKEVMTIEEFVKRFLDRVDPPMAAYQEEKGVAPTAASQGLFNLCRLVASGQFVDAPVARV